MLFPRFSIRSLIALTLAAALCAYSVARANQGEEWAVGVAIALGAMFFCFICFGMLFAASWAFGSLLSLTFSGRRRTATAASPFAHGAERGQGARSPFASPERLPPQVIPDREVPLE